MFKDCYGKQQLEGLTHGTAVLGRVESPITEPVWAKAVSHLLEKLQRRVKDEREEELNYI